MKKFFRGRGFASKRSKGNRQYAKQMENQEENDGEK